jgi:hypothetical protein
MKAKRYVNILSMGFLAIVLVWVNPVSANGFRKILACDDNTVIDLDTAYKQDAQIVIRGESALRYFHDKALATLNWGQNEIVIQGRSGYLDFSKNLPVLSYQDMYSEQDFKSIISLKQPVREGDGQQGDLFYVKRNGSSVLVQKYRLTNHTVTPDPENGQTWYKETALSFLGEYTFNGCHTD